MKHLHRLSVYLYPSMSQELGRYSPGTASSPSRTSSGRPCSEQLFERRRNRGTVDLSSRNDRQQQVPIMLDFVQPAMAVRRLGAGRRNLKRDAVCGIVRPLRRWGGRNVTAWGVAGLLPKLC
jgi:hypothetical protein